MSIYYSVGSIALGLAAWILPLVGLALRRRGRLAAWCSLVSFGACLASLTLQFFEIKHRVTINDLAAIMDTIDALAGVVVILCVVTVLLNAALLWSSRQARG